MVSKLTTPSVCDRPVTSARATEFGRYPSSSIAASTRLRVSGRTCGLPLMTRETVWCETPASRPTSDITGARGRRLVNTSSSIGSIEVISSPGSTEDWSAAPARPPERLYRGGMLALTGFP